MSKDTDGTDTRADSEENASGRTIERSPSRRINSRNTPPSYAALFQCIGPECEDTCCRDWTIPLDKDTYQIYTQFPPGKLGSIVEKSVSTTPDSPDVLYASIQLAPSGFCPFYTPDQLCAIQKEYGAKVLSATCSIYPRTLNRVDGVLEGSLALSCPEAARNILLTPDTTQLTGDLYCGWFRTDNSAHLSANAPDTPYKPYDSFHAVRELLIAMVKDRSLPIWQRLLLIGSLCKRLNAIDTAEHEAQLSSILDDYRQIDRSMAVRAQLESMPTDTRKKLDVVLTLTNERLREKKSGKRFADTFWSFIEGIGTALDSEAKADDCPADDVLRFREAEEKYHRPFFEKRDYLLENYLINYIFQNLFPFGRAGSPHFTRQSIFDEYLLMATQFAWMNALLIGVSGRYKDQFAEEHVIKTVQSFCRAVEHFPYVLVSINEYVRSQKLDSLHGMSILLR